MSEIGDYLESAFFIPWRYPPAAGHSADIDLVGYKVIAADGDIGTVTEATYDPGSAGPVVDTAWILGRRVLLPAGMVERVDVDDRKLYVDRTVAQIGDAPEADPDSGIDEDYRARLAAYYRENR